MIKLTKKYDIFQNTEAFKVFYGNIQCFRSGDPWWPAVLTCKQKQKH